MGLMSKKPMGEGSNPLNPLHGFKPSAHYNNQAGISNKLEFYYSPLAPSTSTLDPLKAACKVNTKIMDINFR